MSNSTVRGAMEATSDTVGVYQYRRGKTPYSTFRIMLYGTWVGTCTLQTSDPGQNVWVNEPDGEFTANTAKVFEPGGDCDVRWIFTSRTSGTARAAIINLA